MVYVKRAAPSEAIIVCKQGKAASINDIAREELDQPKILIGIFMSPFSVHYNRVPIGATLAYKQQYPAEGKNLHMGSMHWRCILGRLPIYANSPHIIQNNRAVSRWRGTIPRARTSPATSCRSAAAAFTASTSTPKWASDWSKGRSSA